MSEHYFGFGRPSKKIPASVAAQIDKIARAHKADFSSPVMPEGPRFWFSTRDYGEPFNGQTERAVLAAVKAAGIDLSKY